jgi:phage terminase large subunit
VFVATQATTKVLELKKSIRLIAGGTSASKTISILQVLIDIAQSSTIQDCQGLPIDVVSETMPHMRGGAMQDFENIMRTQGYWDDNSWNKTLSTYTFETGLKMRFFSADAPSKVHGPRRWILFINEGNNIPWPIADHLIVRTTGVVFVDWNPASEYWAYTEIMQNPAYVGKYDFITLTYKDAINALDQNTVDRIEAHRNNKMWWQVYGLGQLGEIEGRVYTGWKWIDDIPHEARLVKRGLDFGYTNDPTGILAIYEYNGGFIFDEECYQYGMSNRAIADQINSLPDSKMLVIADSSEPKSIDELRLYGINVLAANKGPGSINQGISFLQGQRVSATKRSINLKKEYERYIWLKDRLTDNFTNEAPDIDNHLLDPARYALESYMPRKDRQQSSSGGFSNQYLRRK